jgi:predicted negative regulator of RcsB-dependent stress response
MAAAFREIIPVSDRAAAGAEPPAPVPDPIAVLTGLPADIADPLRGAAAFPEARRLRGGARKILAGIIGAGVVGGLTAAAIVRDRQPASAPQTAATGAARAEESFRPGLRPADATTIADLDEPTTPTRAALRRAQLQVTAGDVRAAENTLRPLLAKQELPRRDLSHAMRLMGSAQARRGRREEAIDWYRKSLRLTDDAAERERVVRIIQRLSHP